jgi:hypothetical protein
MPDKDDYGCLPGRPFTYKAPLTCEQIMTMLTDKSTAGKSTKPTTPARRLPPKIVNMTTLPPPTNGTHYSQCEAVTILSETSDKLARTSIIKQWLEHNLIRFSWSVVYKLLKQQKDSGKMSPKVTMVVKPEDHACSHRAN